jgi:predicted restriction endonuclease
MEKQQTIQQEQQWTKEKNNAFILALRPFYFYNMEVRKRDGDRCQVCDSSSKERLQVHHIFYKNRFPKLAYNMNNGITLCENHHDEIHKFNGY